MVFLLNFIRGFFPLLFFENDIFIRKINKCELLKDNLTLIQLDLNVHKSPNNNNPSQPTCIKNHKHNLPLITCFYFF